MSDERLRSIVERIVEQLVRGNYDQVIQESKNTRMTTEELATAVREYGKKLALPPKDTYQNIDAIQVTRASVPTWSVRVPLWTEEEGRSDLTLEVTIMLGEHEQSVEVDGLHVL